MIPRLALVLSALLVASARADDSFTQSLSPDDFKAAGLDKLTPEELAKLDKLVHGEKAGAAAKATEETTKVVTEEVRQQVQAEDRSAAQKAAASTSIMEKLSVVLRPGTRVEYSTLDAVLVGRSRAWRKGTVFTLTNGQQWVVSDEGSDWESPTDKPIHVRIVPASMGSFFMEIEGGGRPRVKFLRNLSEPAAPPAAQP
jgi:hypothetical protein